MPHTAENWALYKYIRQIIRFYNLEQQITVFENSLEQSRTLRRHYAAYKHLGRWGKGYWALALYGVRTAAHFEISKKAPGPLVALAVVENHTTNIHNICRMGSGLMQPFFVRKERSLSGRLMNMLSLTLQLRSRHNRRLLAQAMRIIGLVDRKYGWVQAINAASFLFGVFAFSNIFSHENKVGFTANDFSPLPLAFKYAGRTAGLRQMFTMHGQISAAASGNQFPRLDYDVSFLYGQAALDAYTASGKPEGAVILTGFPGESLPIRNIPGEIRKIGVCLADYYDLDTQAAVFNIARAYPQAKIYVRPHPRTKQNPDFSSCCNVAISHHKDISLMAADCDFVVAGNTGAQIDMLKLGCPVLHYPALDKLGNDDIGLVANKTALLFDHQTPPTASDINVFFDKGWILRFRYYDALYLVDKQGISDMGDQIDRAYLSLLA